MMLAVTFSFVMLGFGGAGGIINMSYQLNEIGAQHAVGHRALPPDLRRRHRPDVLHGGVRALAAADRLRAALAARLVKTQIWLWFVGMMVLTMPWHLVGLLGMPRRMAYYDYTNPGHRAAGLDGDGVDARRLRAAGLGHPARLHPRHRAAPRERRRSRPSPSAAQRPSRRRDAGGAERLRPVGGDDDRADRRQLRLPDRAARAR